MKHDWPEVTIEQITSKLGDGLHGTPTYSKDGEYYFVNGNNLSNGQIKFDKKTKRCTAKEFEKYKKPLNDRTILVSINGTLGNVAYYRGEKIILGKSACYFNLKEGIEKRFVGYIMTGSIFQKYLERIATGTTIKNVSLKSMREFSFKLPSYVEQRSISSVLGALDDKIENNIRMNEKLYEMARTIFKSWFIDFDPVHAKVNGKKLIHIDAEIAKIFPDSFDDDGLPFGWNEISFGKLVKPKRGKVITKKNSQNGEFPVVAGGVKPAYYHNVYNSKSPVVTISASGNAGFVNIYYSNIWASDCSYINKEITNYVYFSHCFLKINQKKLFDMQHGAVQKHINPNDIMRLTIKIGSNQILDMFEQTVSHLYEKIALNLKENQTLTELRDALLPKLMSGEIRLKDVERELEAAV